VSRCPICESSVVERFIDLGEVPVFCNVQWPTREAATAAPRANLSLAACSDCGHIFNDRYDATLLAYSPGYDNTQHFSTPFTRYAEALVGRLVETYNVRNKAVVDIGCGRGDLLQLICKRGSNRGFGFDPSFAGAADESISSAVSISREYFTAEHARQLAPALVCCRHVLEHVPDPIDFLRTIREAVNVPSRPILYLEVPSGDHLLRSLGLWDYIYEHVSYFSKRSLELALRRSGYEVLAIYEDFGGQFLCADVRAAEHVDFTKSELPNSLDIRATITESAEKMNNKLTSWRRWANELRVHGRSAAVWGAGSKGVMFLNLLSHETAGHLEYAVDQNPHKHGQYISGSGQRVIGPADLVGSPVSQVVLMNAIYLPEVGERLESMQVVAELLSA
jgi:SAM-dependent methyltransferase